MVSKRTLALSASIAIAGLMATGIAAYADGGRHGPRHGGGFGFMQQFDADQDGKLTQAEIDQVRGERLARFDADKDGNLTLKEYEALWLEVMHERMVRSFQRLDRDGDATVTGDEYMSATRNLVARMDRNDDGVLSRDDRRRRDHDGKRRGDHGKRD